MWTICMCVAPLVYFVYFFLHSYNKCLSPHRIAMHSDILTRWRRPFDAVSFFNFLCFLFFSIICCCEHLNTQSVRITQHLRFIRGTKLKGEHINIDPAVNFQRHYESVILFVSSYSICSHIRTLFIFVMVLGRFNLHGIKILYASGF